MNTHQGPSRIARAACAASVLALALMILGPLTARIGLTPPLVGFLLFGLALPFAAGGALLGVFGLWRTRASTGRSGSRAAWTAVLIGSLCLLLVGGLGHRSSSVPAIHDISTDLDDAPQFVALAEAADNLGLDLTYPHGDPETPALQRQAYADLAPVTLALTPAKALDLSSEVAEELGWSIESQTGLHALDGTESAVEGSLEATSTSRTFRFIDDIVVRVRGPRGASADVAIVDVRSRSRVGRSDMGVNALRIRDFLSRLETAARR